MKQFYGRLLLAIKEYSSWSTLLIILLMASSIAFAPYYPSGRHVAFNLAFQSLAIYVIMASLSYSILITLTAIHDSTKLRWVYIFISSSVAAIIGIFIVWQYILGPLSQANIYAALGSSVYYMPFTIVVALLCVFSKSERRAEAARLRHATYKERQQRDLAEMQLRLLQAQIEPHFLYNTMAHLNILITDEPKTALIFLNRLITYLRGVSPIVRQSLVPLKTELKLFCSYLDIQSIRFDNKISYDIQKKNIQDDMQIPSFLLLTLAENAMKHALETSKEGGHISLVFHIKDEKLIITHTNTGQTLNPNWKSGIGLLNIKKRLSSLYMEAATFSLEKISDTQTRACIEIPISDK